MSLFTAGLTGLQAAQTGLATAGHNIANVNTPGYVRQRVNQSPSVPEGNAPLQAGTGVTVSSITRVYNEFLTAQTRDVGSQLAYSQTLSDEINRLSTLFGDESTGIAPALNSFFGSVHDLAANPSDTTSRAAMLSKAESLVDRLQGVDEQLRSYSGQWAQVVQGAVSEVNVYSGTIADLNNKIVLAGASGHPPNELLDQRDQALKELAQRVRVSVVNQGDGSVNVFLGSGQALVVGADRFEVRTEADPANPETLRLSLDNQSGGRVSVDLSSLGGGSLSAQVVAKQRSLDPARIALGRIARVIADDFNEQHGLGVDLSGALGGPLFAVGPTKVQANAANTGGALATSGIFAGNDIGLVHNDKSKVADIRGPIAAANVTNDFPLGDPVNTDGVGEVRLKGGGDIVGAYIGAMNLDNFWSSFQYGDDNIAVGDVRLVSGDKADLLRSEVNGRTLTAITLKDGRVLNGLVRNANERTVTVISPAEQPTLERRAVESINLAEQSMMPEGLVDGLKPDELRDLIAYLMHPRQVPLPSPSTGRP